MKISVIVPLYNAEAYLRQCLDSILGQTHSDLEVILVNDGSTDHSATICEEYRMLDARVKVFHQENQGVSSARNTGLDHATGDFILFVDSDDWLELDCIEKLCYEQDRSASDIVVTNFVVFNQERKSFYFHVNKDQYFIETYSIEEWAQMRYKNEFSMGLCFCFPWGSLYRAELFKNVRYPVGQLPEDNYTSYKLYFLANHVTFINQANYIRRERAGSLVGELHQYGEFPVQTLEQRIALLAVMGFDYSQDIEDYKGLLLRAKNIAMENGDDLAYKENLMKLELIEKYSS